MGEFGDDEVARVARQLLERKSMFLGTTAGDEPWVAGAFFVERSEFELWLILEAAGRTITNIRANPRVAIVVSSGVAHEAFLQGSATVEVVEDRTGIDEIAGALVAKVPEAAPFLDAPIVGARLSVTKWRVTDVVAGWLPGKELVPSGGS